MLFYIIFTKKQSSVCGNHFNLYWVISDSNGVANYKLRAGFLQKFKAKFLEFSWVSRLNHGSSLNLGLFFLLKTRKICSFNHSCIHNPPKKKCSMESKRSIIKTAVASSWDITTYFQISCFNSCGLGSNINHSFIKLWNDKLQRIMIYALHLKFTAEELKIWINFWKLN